MGAMGIVLDLAILALVIGRQVKKRPLAGYTLPAVLAVLGLGEFGSFFFGSTEQFKEFARGQQPLLTAHDTKAVIIALAGSLLISIALAAARVPTIRLWRQGGQWWRQGNVWTVALWLASVTLHLAYNAIVSHKVAASTATSGFGSATLMLYFGVSLITQRILLGIRAQRVPEREAED